MCYYVVAGNSNHAYIFYQRFKIKAFILSNRELEWLQRTRLDFET